MVEQALNFFEQLASQTTLRHFSELEVIGPSIAL